MKTSDFYYDLPEELIAQDPLEDRSSSRLMILDKETGKTEHHVFREIIDELNPGDCLVINDTKVIPARLIGAKEDTGAKIEVLLLKRKEEQRRLKQRRSIIKSLFFCFYSSCVSPFLFLKNPILLNSGFAYVSRPITMTTVRIPSITASGICVGANTPRNLTADAPTPPASDG